MKLERKDIENIANNQPYIETLRKDSGISKDEVLKCMNISEKRYDRIVSGKVQLKASELISFCMAIK